ncbi:MAG: LysR family transcriptional regulator [Salinisphaera sp.]|uniref:LysR family transcriptional regulator n=1 Tax=Salinisphaera sp. TaxID=1914330 RepID=UPI003C7A94CC
MDDLQCLHAFVLVAHEGSVTRAAERLHLTQPAISLKIKRLQESLQLTLFQRQPQGLVLTADGRALLPAAERALSSMAAFNQSARSLTSTLRGHLRLGTIIDPEFIRLGAFLHRLVQQAPQIETKLSHGMSGTVLAKVEHGELDAGFYLSAPGTGTGKLKDVIDHRELTVFDYYVVGPTGWSETVRHADWPHLTSLPWIVTPPSSVHNRLLKSALKSRGLTLRPAAQVDQETSMLTLVRAGVGLSLARDATAMAERQEHGLAVAKRVHLPCALSFIWKKNRGEDEIINQALNVLSDVWGAPESANPAPDYV